MHSEVSWPWELLFAGHGYLFIIYVLLFSGVFFSPVNCWPNEAGSTCDVNIEYDLEMPDMELTDVVISIPVP